MTPVRTGPPEKRSREERIEKLLTSYHHYGVLLEDIHATATRASERLQKAIYKPA